MSENKLSKEEKKLKENKLPYQLIALQDYVQLLPESEEKEYIIDQIPKMRRTCKSYAEVIRLSDLICLRFRRMGAIRTLQYISYLEGELIHIKEKNILKQLTDLQEHLQALPECERKTDALKQCKSMKELCKSYAEVLRLSNDICECARNDNSDDIPFYIKPLRTELYKIYIT